MTKRILTSILAILFASVSLAEDPSIEHIRKEYQAIQDVLPHLKTETVDLSGYSTEGGEAKAFRDGKGSIRLVKVVLFFESGKEHKEFYYGNGELTFVLYTNHRYNAPFFVTSETAKEIGGEAFDQKKTTITEDRYYFKKEKMIRWLDEERNQVSLQNKEFKDAEKEILEFSNEILSQFKRD